MEVSSLKKCNVIILTPFTKAKLEGAEAVRSELATFFESYVDSIP